MTSSEDPGDLAAQAQPIPAKDNLNVPLSDIPLPPEELRAELDNSGNDAAEPEQSLEIATLDFCGDELPSETFPLKYPFRWEGERVDAIVVTQLSVHQIGKIYAHAAREKRAPDYFEFYAAMCGLPAKVLRALPAADGEPIVNKAFDFLPQSARPAPG